MADVSDKKRLRQVQQQDLTESRLNDDFVFWLKTKGVNYLLILLVAACVWMGWNWFKERKEAERNRAWNDFAQATLPQAYDEVARLHPTTDSVALLSWIRAGDAHLREIQTGLIGASSLVPGPNGLLPDAQALDAEALTIARTSADAYYARVLENAGSGEGHVAFRVAALFGRAAVAESKNDLTNAKLFLEQAAALAEGPYPAYAALAKVRLESLPLLANHAELPPAASLPTRPTTLTPTAVNPEELIRSLQGQPAPAPPAAPQPAQPEAEPAPEPVPEEPAPATPPE